jgi:DNA-binding NarL/FixJ family response regulator
MKVLIADDQSLTRQGLASLFRKLDRQAVVLEAGNLQEAMDIASREKDISLIVLDSSIPGINGLESVRKLGDRCPDAALVVTSDVEERSDMLRAIEIGANGYIPKSLSFEKTVDAFRLVLAGNVYLPPGIARRGETAGSGTTSEGHERSASADLTRKLTRRQRDVLKLIGEGHTNKEIAVALGMSENTVRVHVSAILKSLELTNRTQAALLAAQVLK